MRFYEQHTKTVCERWLARHLSGEHTQRSFLKLLEASPCRDEKPVPTTPDDRQDLHRNDSPKLILILLPMNRTDRFSACLIEATNTSCREALDESRESRIHRQHSSASARATATEKG